MRAAPRDALMAPRSTRTPLVTPSRSNGLDTLRALAIVLVFTYHYSVFVTAEPSFGWASTAGWIGVDLFFVLSGYRCTALFRASRPTAMATRSS